MKDMVKTYFTVAWIVALITGIIYSLTIVGLIIGIPLFMGAKRFKRANEMLDDELIANRSNLFGWGIFLAIVLAPSILGLAVVLVFVIMVNNYILNMEKGEYTANEKSFEQTLKDGAKNIFSNVKETVGVGVEVFNCINFTELNNQFVFVTEQDI